MSESTENERTRVDKWLWAARFFKTRSLAAKACELGRIESGEFRLKASREVRVGNRLRIRNDGGVWEVEVLALSDIRGPAAVAQTLYSETETGREARLREAEERKARAAMEGIQPGKISKRNRRLLGRMRGRL